MRRLCLLLFAIVVGTLAAPTAAAAKEVSEVRVCGSHECTTYTAADFKSLMFLAQDDGPTDPPSAPAPWYRVRFTVDEREHGGGYARWTVAYVPSADSLRVRDDGGGFTWVALNPRAAAALGRAARALPALPRARLAGLPVEPPTSRTAPAATSERAGGPTPWGWIAAAAALCAGLALAAAGGSVRRRRHVQPAGL